jgi:quinoprotein glucose dehydrogenase
MNTRRALTLGVAVALLWASWAAWTPAPVHGQTGATNGEWRTYGGDLASTRYSPLDQVNAQNFNNLEVAWRFRTDALGPRVETNLQVTPLMVNGRMFTTAGTRRAAVALDAATGELLWMHSLRGEARRRRAAALSGRGLRPVVDAAARSACFT